MRALQPERARGRRDPFHSELVSNLDPDAPTRQAENCTKKTQYVQR